MDSWLDVYAESVLLTNFPYNMTIACIILRSKNESQRRGGRRTIPKKISEPKPNSTKKFSDVVYGRN